jgi:hypothetical protein
MPADFTVGLWAFISICTLTWCAWHVLPVVRIEAKSEATEEGMAKAGFFQLEYNGSPVYVWAANIHDYRAIAPRVEQ